MRTLKGQYARIFAAFAGIAAAAGILLVSTFWVLIKRDIEFSVGRQFENILFNLDGQLQEINLIFNTQQSLSSYMAYYYDQHGHALDKDYLKNTRTFANDIARSLYGLSDLVDYFAIVHENGQVLLEYKDMAETHYRDLGNITASELFRRMSAASSFLYREKNEPEKLYIVRTITHSKGTSGKHYLLLRLRSFDMAGLKEALSILLYRSEKGLPFFNVPLHDGRLLVKLRDQAVFNDGLDPSGSLDDYLVFKVRNELTQLDFTLAIAKKWIYIYLLKSSVFITLLVLLPALLLFVLLRRHASEVTRCFSGIRGHIDSLLDRTDYAEKSGRSENYAYKEFNDVEGAFNHLTKRLHDYSEEIKSASKAAAIGQTTAMLAHDVRKPFSQLKSVLGMLGNIKDDPSELARVRSDVERSVGHVENMISEIMDFSRKTKPEMRPVSLAVVLDFSLRQVAHGHRHADISFSYELLHTLKLAGDDARLGRVFSNLIDNAIDAITVIGKKSAGAIRFGTSDIVKEGRRYVLLNIANNGPAIDALDLPRIFEPFFTKGKQKGSGLGLASVKRIVELHEGTISVRNIEKGGGVEFSLCLPAAEEKDTFNITSLPGSLREILPGDAKEGGEALSDKEIKLLLLEDEALYRASVRNTIKSDESLNKLLVVYDAETVEEALKLIARENIMYAIADIDLGADKDGFDFLREARKRFPYLRVMVHSNRFLPEDMKKAEELGAAAFSAKPLTLGRLRALVGVPAAGGAGSGQDGKSAGNGDVVLFCDDDRLSRRCAEFSLKKTLPAAQVYLFPDAEELLKKLGELEKNIASGRLACTIFTDQNMGGMSGLELIENIRERDISCRIYMISNEPKSVFGDKATASGADGYFEGALSEDIIASIFNKD